MLLFSTFLLFSLTVVDAQLIPCEPGAQMTINETACHLTADLALSDRIILFMISNTSFTINFIDGMDTETNSANSTLLKLDIFGDKVFSTCITATGDRAGPTETNKYSKLVSPIKREFLFSVGFYGNESRPSPKWNIENQNMSLGYNCPLALKPNGKYMQLYFDKNTNYQIYSAIKCVKK